MLVFLHGCEYLNMVILFHFIGRKWPKLLHQQHPFVIRIPVKAEWWLHSSCQHLSQWLVEKLSSCIITLLACAVLHHHIASSGEQERCNFISLPYCVLSNLLLTLSLCLWKIMLTVLAVILFLVVMWLF